MTVEKSFSELSFFEVLYERIEVQRKLEVLEEQLGEMRNRRDDLDDEVQSRTRFHIAEGEIEPGLYEFGGCLVSLGDYAPCEFQMMPETKNVSDLPGYAQWSAEVSERRQRRQAEATANL